MCEEENSHASRYPPPPSLGFLTLSADPHPLSGREIVFCTAPSSFLILYERGYDLQSIKHHWGTLRSARHIRKVERGKDSPTIFHQLGKGPHGEMSGPRAYTCAARGVELAKMLGVLSVTSKRSQSLKCHKLELSIFIRSQDILV